MTMNSKSDDGNNGLRSDLSARRIPTNRPNNDMVVVPDLPPINNPSIAPDIDVYPPFRPPINDPSIAPDTDVYPPFRPPINNPSIAPDTDVYPLYGPRPDRPYPPNNRPIFPIWGPGPVIFPPHPNTSFGSLRFLYAAVNQPAVDVSIDNNTVIYSMRYSNVTPYYAAATGRRRIVITNSRNGAVLASMNLPITNNQIYTVALINGSNGIQLTAISDADCRRTPGMACLRAVNLIANSGSSNIFLSGQGLVFRNVQFRDITNYTQLRPGNYTVYATDRNTTIFPIATQIMVAIVGGSFRPWITTNIGLERNTTYTLYLIGNLNGFPSPQAMLVETDLD